MHYPVMLSECLDYLSMRPDGVYLDATAGMGGHTGAIARRLETGLLVSADRDAESLARAQENTSDAASRVRFLHSPFSGLKAALSELGIGQVDGMLADLGVSRYQLTDPERGFSLMSAGPLDMRMDRSQETTAADLVNHSSERDLADWIYYYGDERRARRIARAIVRARPIRDTLHLARVVEEAAPRTGPLHPATLTFMALRIAVNREREELDALLDAAPTLVKPGGRFVVLTFMSIEDRQVKHRFQEWGRAGRARILTKHVVKPGEGEVRENPPSRSAKLRAVELVG